MRCRLRREEVWRSHPAPGNGMLNTRSPCGHPLELPCPGFTPGALGVCPGRGALALRCCRSHCHGRLSQPCPTALAAPALCPSWAGSTRTLSVVTSVFASLHGQRRDPLGLCLLSPSNSVTSRFLVLLSQLPLLLHLSREGLMFAEVLRLPTVMDVYFCMQAFQKFLTTLNPFLTTLYCFFPLEYFSHQFSFSFPSGSGRITKPQFTVSENRRYFPPLSLSRFGICNLLPPFLFSYKKQCVPYVMAYIKQFFIDLGSAYSFLEGIQIWLGNWNTCMLHF